MARSEMACSMEARVMTAPDRACVRLSDALPATRVGATEARKDVPPRPDARGRRLTRRRPRRSAACRSTWPSDNRG